MSHRHGRCCGSCEKDNIIVMWSDNSALSALIIQRPSVFLARSCVRVGTCECSRPRSCPFPFCKRSPQIRETGNMRKRIWHLCSLCCCQGAQIRAQGRAGGRAGGRAQWCLRERETQLHSASKPLWLPSPTTTRGSGDESVPRATGKQLRGPRRAAEASFFFFLPPPDAAQRNWRRWRREEGMI